MAVSVFDLFKIGIGPSSSHTVGPMRAACRFAHRLEERGVLGRTVRLRGELFGSLAHTGRGHGTDKAVFLGFEGAEPDRCDPDQIPATLERIRQSKRLRVSGKHEIAFDEKTDLVFNKRQKLPYHSNGMRFTAFDERDEVLFTRDYYSVGGGFVVNHDEAAADRIVPDATPLPHPFTTGDELLKECAEAGLSIAGVMRANERAWRSEAEIRAGLLHIWQAMQDCVTRGLREDGVLPGGLKVARRAPAMYRELLAKPEAALRDPLTILDWVNLYALAVNEENAAGGRVVTAPTNGAAGIVPAVMHYYTRFCPGANDDGVVDFMLTAGAIGILYKENASISGAEVGCQGEVGVACSMAAGGLAAALGGNIYQVENAAEIGMEHNLGLTCDPIGGLVQIPCIERNAMGAVKAINASRMALRSDGKHHVSLDKVIKTMRDTGRDMQDKYKETSRGGLAVNVIEVLMRTLLRWMGAGLRGLGQAWAILGLTLLLLLLVDHLLRALLPDPLAATPFEAGAVAPARERAAAVAGDDWIGRYWREHAGARDTEWRSYVYWRRKVHQGEIINVDAHGFRVTPPLAGPAEREIWLFGGSVVWGTGNRDSGTLAAQLQQVYAERAPELRVRVLNFGESGYVSRQSLAAFQSALACAEPAADLAVFLDGANDVFATLQARRAGLPQNEDNRRREFNTSRRFAAQLRAWAMQLEGIGRLVAAAPAPFDEATIAGLAADTADVWLATVGQAQAIGAALDVAVLPLWQPTAFDRNPPRADEAGIVGASPADHVHLQRATRAAVQARLEHAPLAHDLGGIFDGAGQPLYFDFVHLSEAAQRLLAERIFELSVDSVRSRPARPRTLEACSDRPLG